MQLEIENGPTINDPGATAIAEGLKLLDGDKFGFAILSAKDGSFVQTAGGVASGFTLEYKDEKSGRQYVCSKDVQLKEITETFQRYAKRDDTWKERHVWEPLQPPKPGFVRPSFAEGSFRMSPPLIAFSVPILTFLIALYFSKRKGARMEMWVGIFFISLPVPLVVSVVETQRSGRYKNRYGPVVTRSGAPLRFWTHQVMYLAAALLVIVVGVLAIRGAFPVN